MRLPEQKLWDMVRDKTKHLPVHWQRVETAMTGAGVPDLNMCYKGIEMWVELKVTATTRPEIRPLQCSWHLKRHRAGGRSLFLIQHVHDGGPRKGDPVNEIVVVQGQHARELADTGFSDIDQGIWEVDTMSWAAFMNWLIEKPYHTQYGR